MSSLGLQNWSGNLEYKARKLHEPGSISEVQAIVRESGHLRVLGSRHCFNGIADCEELISLRHLSKVELHQAEARVSVYGSITYAELCPFLQEHGFALPNLASLPHISVAGAIASATHGAGQQNGNLATAVVALQLVNGAGEVLDFTDTEPERLRQVIVNLGCLGVVTRITLQLEPSFLVYQRCFDGLWLSDISSQETLDSVLGAAYSVSLWTTWAMQDDDMEFYVWLKDRVTPAESTLPKVLQRCVECKEQQHPLKGHDPSACTEQGSPGPWHQRLPHFKMEHMPSSGAELQSEYFVPRRRAAEALRALAAISSRFRGWLMASEIRAIAADALLLSPHRIAEDGCVGFHFTWQLAEAEVTSQALPEIERVLEAFDAVPHWGKIFLMQRPRLEHLYGNALVEFRQLAKQLDPEGKFCNEWVQQTIGDYTQQSPTSAL